MQICRALRLCKRRWPKAPPRGALGEYAVSPRSDLRSPASLPAATRRDPAFTKQPPPQKKPFLQPSNNHSNYNPTTTQPSFVSNPRTIPTQPFHIRDSPDPTTLSCMALARPLTALAAASLPTQPAARRRSPSCRQWCHECCRRRETQTLVKWALRGVHRPMMRRRCDIRAWRCRSAS